jgi:hypothetical protein
MLKRTLLLTCALVLTCGIADAQHQGTRADEDACKRDVVRHCRRVLDQGDMVILDCLKTNARKLTKACRKVLEDNGQL